MFERERAESIRNTYSKNIFEYILESSFFVSFRTGLHDKFTDTKYVKNRGLRISAEKKHNPQLTIKYLLITELIR